MMVSVKKRTVGVIGLGNVAEPHLDAYAMLDCVQLVGVTDPRLERCREVAERYRVPGFASCEALLAERRPDIVCILTPASTHRLLTAQCAATGVHVLCEKPIAVTLEDARAMADVCQAAKVQFFYGSSYRYLPAVQESKRLIDAGAIGAVRTIVEQVLTGEGAEAYRPLSAAHYPQGGPGGGGYGLVDHGVHMLDIFPWLCRSAVSSVLGRGDRTGAVARPELALMMMQNGTLGVLLYDESTRPADLPEEGIFSEGRQWLANRGWAGEAGNWDPHPGNIRVYGSKGSLRIFPYANRLFLNISGQMQERTLPAGTTPWHFGTQMRAFCANLDRGELPSTSAEDGIQALRALLAIYESEASTHWQSVGVN